MTATCKVCGASATKFSVARILNRYDIGYFLCPECGFLQTEEPYWLADAYSEAINAGDVGLVRRNLELSRAANAVIVGLFEPSARFLDFGGGYGLFVRLMRDRGFNFFRYDKYCDNLFARGFDAGTAGSHDYELVTAFEVFEHFVDPVGELEEVLTYSDSVFFTTVLLPTKVPQPHEWWYFGLDHGQHISFYTMRSLEVLAARFDLHLCSDGRSRHLFSRKKCNPFLFKILNHPLVNPLVTLAARRKPLSEPIQKEQPSL